MTSDRSSEDKTDDKPETQTETHFCQIPNEVVRDLAFIACLHGAAQRFHDTDQAARHAWDLAEQAMTLREQKYAQEKAAD